MIRTPEPELMADPAQADAYASADLSELQQAMVAHFEARFSGVGYTFARGTLLDLGCGAGDMAIRFAQAYPSIRVLGADGSGPLLDHARRAIAARGLTDRIRVEQHYLPATTLAARSFDAVIANSLLHHLADPVTLWRTAIRCATPGAPVMAMDLRRPADVASAERLVALHGREARPVLRQDFFNSLCAAYRADEIRRQLDDVGLTAFQVEEVGDLHVLVWGVAP